MTFRSSGASLAIAAWLIALSASRAPAQVLERGTIVDRVQCAGNPEQTYALYLPSTYSPERKWNLILAFHPAARGRMMVEKFQAAAEEYGYVVAASNNSRNGPYAVSQAAAQAMIMDVGQRFNIDPQRVYLAGMSGGARVATGIALGNKNIAGVIASSAGYPDSQPRVSVSFAIFSTAGTEDFNYMEMRLLDRKLTSYSRAATPFPRTTWRSKPWSGWRSRPCSRGAAAVMMRWRSGSWRSAGAGWRRLTGRQRRSTC